MRIPLLALMILLPAFSQTTASPGAAAGQQLHVTVPTPDSPQPVTVSANSIIRDMPYPSVLHLKGNVEIKMPVCIPAKGSAMVCDGYMTLTADEADFNENTGKIDARGSVSVTPLRHEKERRKK
jgi:hypothetical protein